MMRFPGCAIGGFLWLVFFSILVQAVPVAKVEAENAQFTDVRGAGFVLRLVVHNTSQEEWHMPVELALLDVNGRFQPLETTEVSILPGIQHVAIPVSSLWSKETGTKWRQAKDQQIHYSLKSMRAQVEIEGVCPYSPTEAKPYGLQVSGLKDAVRGAPYRLQVKAYEKDSNLPVPHVVVTGVLRYESDSPQGSELKQLTVTATSGADGMAFFTFPLEKTADYANFITFTADFGTIQVSRDFSFGLSSATQAALQTDKPLYQPGETLHLRAQLFEPDGQVVGGEPVTFTVYNSEAERVFEATQESTRWGIVKQDWEIPETAKPGEYTVEVHSKLFRNNWSSRISSTRIHINHYKLPEFSLQVQTDRSFYLPGQKPAVTIRAQAFSGKPLTGGIVRLSSVKPSPRPGEPVFWEEGAFLFEGVTSPDGSCSTELDLSRFEKQKQFVRYLGNQLYQDLELQGGVTDPESGKTESVRFVIRLTAQPIHIYLYQAHTNRPQSHGMPLLFAVSTVLADGTPVPCRVQIGKAIQPGADQSYTWSWGGVVSTPITEVQTNRYGLAEVQLASSLVNWEDGTLPLLFKATDFKGRQGIRGENLWISQDPILRLSTDRTLYRQGEPLHLHIYSNQTGKDARVLITHNRVQLDWQKVTLKNGEARLTIPFRPEFQGELLITAFSPDTPQVRDSQTVRFPTAPALRLNVAPGNTSSQGGGPATLLFQVTDAHGKPVESVMGVTVADAAAETAYGQQMVKLTENPTEVALNFWTRSDGLSWPTSGKNPLQSLGGLCRADLAKFLQQREVIPPEVQLTARWLARIGDFNQLSIVSESADGQANPANPADHFKELRKQLTEHLRGADRLPASLDELDRRWPVKDLKDPWGNPYRVTFFTVGGEPDIEVLSAGPDGRMATLDDITVVRDRGIPFRSVGTRFHEAVQAWEANNKTPLVTAASLKQELLALGVDFDQLRDQWGRPLRLEFHFRGRTQVWSVLVKSAGANGRFESDRAPMNDDVPLWIEAVASQDRFTAGFWKTVTGSRQKFGHQPRTQAEWQTVFRQANLSRQDFSDPWGQPFYLRFGTRIDRRIWLAQTKAEAGAPLLFEAATQTTPPGARQVFTSRVHTISLSSCGPDRKKGTADDVELTSSHDVVFLGPLQPNDPVPSEAPNDVLQVGKLRGIVTDFEGGPLSGATVTCEYPLDKWKSTTTTKADGSFEFEQLPVRLYRVSVAGKLVTQTAELQEVPVMAGATTLVPLKITQGPFADPFADSNLVRSSPLKALGTSDVLLAGQTWGFAPLTTPHIRKCYPETLVWQPELVTDQTGRAKLECRLPDSLTTWKLTVTATTTDGRVVTAQTELMPF